MNDEVLPQGTKALCHDVIRAVTQLTEDLSALHRARGEERKRIEAQMVRHYHHLQGLNARLAALLHGQRELLPAEPG